MLEVIAEATKNVVKLPNEVSITSSVKENMVLVGFISCQLLLKIDFSFCFGFIFWQAISWFWLVSWVYSISTFVGYLKPNPFLCK